MMFFTDENHYCRGILEMVNTTTSKVFRNCEIVLAFKEKSLIMMALQLRKASIHWSEAETIDMGGSL
ncbi:MAG: hypothetical protein AB2L14_02000 [Candidatus Xenobiia bacterium LiM19]